MGVLNNSMWNVASGSSDFYEYKITNSLRLNGTDQALEKTWGAAATTNKKFAISVWVKRTGAEGTNSEFGSTTNTKLWSASSGNGAANDMIEFNTGNPSGYSDHLGYSFSGGAAWGLKRYRDPSAWYQVVMVYDSTQSTATSRIRIYINGEQEPLTSDSSYWDINNTAQVNQNTDSSVGQNGHQLHIGRYVYDDAGWWGGQMADFICIDGAAAISDFGETKNGVWVPKDPSGLTFGNNGFWLKFTNSSAMGEDYSGNDNDFAHIGTISTHDQLIDSPTNNFPAINPLNLFSIANSGLKEANLVGEGGSSGSASGGNWRNAYCTFQVPLSGSYYWEFVSANHVYAFPAIQTMAARANTNSHNTDFSIVQAGEYRIDGSNDANTSNISTGDIIGIWVNDSQVKVYVNNSLDHTFSSNLTAGKDYFPTVVGSELGYFNFGQDSSFAGQKTAQGNADSNGIGDFYYSPKGLALCSANITVADTIDPNQTDSNYPQKLFSATTYSGNDTTNNVTGVGFQPDLLLFKIRSTASSGLWVDTNRGRTTASYSINADAEFTIANITAIGADGFSLDGTSDYKPNFNNNTHTYVAWAWRANGGTTSTNSTGTVNGTQQVDPSGAFSLTTYTGTGSSMTVGHGLSAEPKLTIVKDRGASANWIAYTKLFDTSLDYLFLNTTAAKDNSGFTGPNSSIWNFDGESSYSNTSSRNYVMYNFTNIEGYCKVGVYEGNGNAEGTFVYTGFRPAFIVCKSGDSTSNWQVFDDERLGYNDDNNESYINIHDAEATTDMIDILSNGFKFRIATDPNVAETYLYMAMAHNPFKYATAR